jgi:hypothetical protein
VSNRKEAPPQHQHVEIKTELYIIAPEAGQCDPSHMVVKDCKGRSVFASSDRAEIDLESPPGRRHRA